MHAQPYSSETETSAMERTGIDKQVLASGLLLGIGLGGFVDGILLHQILQWHNMLSAVIPPDTLPDMKVNMLWDGLFHAATWVMTVIGVALLWKAARDRRPLPTGKVFAGLMLAGWGVFNLVEGLIDHELLGIHHVKEIANPLPWDMAFLAIGGVAFIAVGWLLARPASSVRTYPPRTKPF